MRKINEIVVHHSVTPRDLDPERSLKSFNNNHYNRLYLKYKQPLSGTEWEFISYHAVIDGKGKIWQTRKDHIVGYHASNLNVNNKSLGVCLIGSFDKEQPSKQQLESLEAYIKEKSEMYDIEVISPHRKYAAHKTCPGFNVSDSYINGLLHEDQFAKYKQWGINLPPLPLCNDMNWDKPCTKQEIVKMINHLEKHITFMISRTGK